jgi:hypothetical protein
MQLIDAQASATQVLDAERRNVTTRYLPPSAFANEVAFRLSPLNPDLHPKPVSEDPGSFRLQSRNYELLKAFLEAIQPHERPSYFETLRARVSVPGCFKDVGPEILGAGKIERTHSELPLVAEFLVRESNAHLLLTALPQAPLRPGFTRLLLHLEQMIAFDYRLFSNEEYDELDNFVRATIPRLSELRRKPRISDVTESNYRFHVCEEGPVLCNSLSEQCKRAKYLRLVSTTLESRTSHEEIDPVALNSVTDTVEQPTSQLSSEIQNATSVPELELETMIEIKDCLPQHAVAHFLTLRNIRDESEIGNREKRLVESRRQAAARGSVANGMQIYSEWKIIRETQEAQVIGHIADLLETCRLYDISITRQLCDCVLQAVNDLLVIQRKHALQAIALRLSSTTLPRTVLLPMEGEAISTAVSNRVKAALEKARVESEKAEIAMANEKQRAAQKEGHTFNYVQNITQHGGVMNASQAGNVNVQHLTTEQLNALQPELAALRATLKAHDILEADEGVGLLAGAEKAAKDGDESKMLGLLKQIPAKAWELGKPVISAALLGYLKAHGLIP